MQSQQAEALQGAVGLEPEELAETVYFPPEGRNPEAGGGETDRQLGARPKATDPGVSSQKTPPPQWQEGGRQERRLSNSSPTRTEQIHWRVIEPGGSLTPVDWNQESPPKSQSLLDLPETFERLQLGHSRDLDYPSRERPHVVQPKFIFPVARERDMTDDRPCPEEKHRESPFFSVAQPGVLPAQPRGDQPQPSLIDFSNQPTPQLPPPFAIPPGWAYFPERGWIPYQTPQADSKGIFPTAARQNIPPRQAEGGARGAPTSFQTQQPVTMASAFPPSQSFFPPRDIPEIPLVQQVARPNLAPQHPLLAPPIFKATYDGQPSHLDYFVSRIEAFVGQYRLYYTSDRSLINTISDGMNTGLAAEWIAQLHNEHAPELDNIDGFIALLRNRFQDEDLVAECEATLKSMKQGNKPLKQFVWDFRRVAGNLRHWPERVLLHYFKEAINRKVREACATRGIPERLNDWYNVSVALDREFHPYQPQSPTTTPQQVTTKPSFSRPTTTSTPQLQCYRCGKRGHRASTCRAPAPIPRHRLPTATRARRPPRTNPNTNRVVGQAWDTNFLANSSTEPPPTEGPPDEPDDGENDPMVSAPIPPFVIKVNLIIPGGEHIKELEAIVDTGCTRCLISTSVVSQLHIKTFPLKRPIKFHQVDGTLIGGVPASQLTQPLHLEIGDHHELIRFIVVPKMSESIILGLAWLDKWKPTIKWEDECRKMIWASEPTKPLPASDQQNAKTDHQGEAVSTVSGPLLKEPRIPNPYMDLADVFSEKECNLLPPHRQTDCAIELHPGAKLPKPKMYSMTPAEMSELRHYIDTNLARKFIEPAKSPVAAPVLFKQKKDGSLRLCIDFRNINAICVQNTYPLPLMHDLLNHLSKGRIFTRLDLKEAYYRVRIKEGDEWKTAFNCPLGSFQYRVMPFGLQGAPAVFMQLINETLHPHLYNGVLVYLNDILIYTDNMEQHVKLVRQVLKKLLAAKLYVKLSKCEFHKESLDYLGYRISSKGIEMDPDKVKAVLDWQPPRTRKQLQSFLGFANFYRKFIPSFAEVALPLTELLKTGPSPTKPKPSQPLAWTMNCQRSFEHLKRLFSMEPILQHPDPDKPFVVQADASDVAVAAVLLQRNDNNELLPCSYISKKLTDTERRWSVWEKEAFAVKWALLSWRHFLEGCKEPFEVWTDHKNLEYLKTPRKLSPKQVRWAQFFNRFQFTLKYIPGDQNLLADALSRKPQFDSQREEIIHPMVPDIETVNQVLPHPRPRRRTHTTPTELLSRLKSALADDAWFKEHSTDLTLQDGLPWKGTKIYVPVSMRIPVLQRSHDSRLGGHFGYLKTLHLARRQFWWPKMKSDVEDYVRSCATCATMKSRPGKPPGLLQPVAEPTRPWEEIAMDFIVDLPPSGGHTVIWTVIDLFSKQAHFTACTGLPSAKKLAKLFVKHIYRLHGVPKRIISDRGVQFTARFWKEFLRSIGSSQGLSSAFHPQTNGAAEKLNLMVEQYIRCYINYQQENWSDLLPFAEVAYNNAVHSSTGLTPFQINTGMDFVPMPELPVQPPTSISLTDWMNSLKTSWENTKKALAIAARKYKAQADKHRSLQPPFRIGDKVFLSTKYLKLRIPTKKFGPKFLGPFPIIKIINPVTVQLKLPRILGKIHPVFHSSLLRPARTSTLRPLPSVPPPPLIIQGETHYVVKKILDSRIYRGQLEYLIHWKGYPISESTWVKSWDVNADKLVKRFHDTFPDKPKGPLGGGRGG